MREMRDSGLSWLGKIPADWEVLYPKQLFQVRKERAREDDVMLTASQHLGMVPQDEFMKAESYTPVVVEKGHDILKHVEPGDFVISMRSFQGGLEYSRVRGKMSSAYLALYPIDRRVEDEYFKWLFKSDGYISSLQSTSNLVRDGQALRFANFIQVFLPLPPSSEQKAIAAYLDKACADIDRAIEAAESSIDEYLTYKYSVIYSAVTTGIGNADLGATGIEWMESIPANWDTIEVGRLAEQIKCPNDGMRESNLLSLSYGTVRRRDINSNEGLLPASFETYNIIEDGDIVLRFTDLQNDQKSLRVGRATERGIITSAYVVVRPHDYDSSRYIYYALHSYDLRKGFYGMGAGVRQGLKWQEARYIPIPQPPLEEQIAIADYLDEKCAQIDAAIAAKRSIIDELKAYKKSLVYEYVTGKREVPCQ